MKLTSVEERVKYVVASYFGIAEANLNLETRFIDDLGADSLDRDELWMDLEDEFKIEIPANLLTEVKTIKEVIDYFHTRKMGL